jgi:penicillin-binding protein 1A
MNKVLIAWQRLNAFLLLEKPWFKKIVRITWILFFAFILGVTSFVFLVLKNPYDLFGAMPSLKAVENPENDLSSEVISSDGVSLGRFFTYNRSQISYDELPPVLVKTLLISEDHRFYDHSGMDFWSYTRVIWGIITFDAQGGGSTLTQQTAKNLFNTRQEELQGKLAELASPLGLLISKIKEWIIAVQLERNFTKEEIIALYLNTVPFNNNAYGIKIAAETYFNKPLHKLQVHETALLVGMLQGTHRFNPIEFPERAKKKRNDVLNKLYTHHYLKSKRQCDSLKALPLQLNFSVQNQNLGLATYFRSVLKSNLRNWCKENGYDLAESGLKIYTTIDSRMQRFAEEAMMSHMQKLQKDFNAALNDRDPWIDNNGKEGVNFLQRKIKRTDTFKNLMKRYGASSDSIQIMLNKKKRMRIFTWRGDRDTLFSSMDSLRYYNRFLQTGMMSMNPTTGEIKAWVGGINHKYFKYDHVHQSKRQPGSTFKAFVYGKAMEDGYSPCQLFNDLSPTINIDGKIYQAANSNGSLGDGSSLTLRQALARSLNSVTMQLMDRLKPANVADFANRVGINSKLDPVYSLGLGTSDVSLEEMVAAYCGFVNLGIYTEPYYITRIEDKNGNVIANFIPKTKQVMSQETAYKILYLLRGGVEEEGGTSNRLSANITTDNEVGGKTGTTDNASDGWYIGVTHNLVTGVWVGGDEPSIHFPSWSFGSGGRTALPIWDRYMQKVYAHPEVDFPKGQFKQPDERPDMRDCDEYPPLDSANITSELSH